jgi:hypothetical protein
MEQQVIGESSEWVAGEVNMRNSHITVMSIMSNAQPNDGLLKAAEVAIEGGESANSGGQAGIEAERA